MRFGLKDLLKGDDTGDSSGKSHFMRFLKSKQAILVKTILFKWYYMIMVPAVMAAYYFFKALQENGLLARIEKAVTDGLGITVNVAKECTHLLPHIFDFVNCAGTIN